MSSTDGHFKIFYGMHMGLTAIQHCHIERRIECWGICIHILKVPESSTALNDAVGSKDKSIIEFPSGHVGLIMGQRAHKEDRLSVSTGDALELSSLGGY
jgi:hypothetical protein